MLIEGDKTWTLEERMKFYKVEGVSVAVIRDNKIEWAKGYGLADTESRQPVTTSTLFQAASVSKPVAAMGALVLVEDGKLSLDGDVNKFLKSWKVPANEYTAKAPVTLEGLLSHTAGLTVHGFPGYGAGARLTRVLIAIASGISDVSAQSPAPTPKSSRFTVALPASTGCAPAVQVKVSVTGLLTPCSVSVPSAA